MPNTPNMEREPARTIGEIFADKVLLKPVIASMVALVAGAFNLTVEVAVVDNLTTVVVFLAVVYGALGAQLDQKRLALEQAEETREAVYAPSTVKEIAASAAVTGDATIPAPPAK